METAYGIGVQNRYALFLDEDDNNLDPYSLLNNSPAKPDSKTSVGKMQTASGGASGGSIGTGLANAPKQTSNKNSSSMATSGTGKQHHHQDNKSALSESKTNVAANQKDAGRQNRNRFNNQNQRPNRENQENRINRSPRAPNQTGNKFETNNEDAGKDYRDAKEFRRNAFRGPRGGGPGGGLGGRPGGPPGGRPKRDFNRHSGSDKSGVKSFEKREGGGAHNWGKPVDEFNTSSGDVEEMVNGQQATTGDEAEKSDNPEQTENVETEQSEQEAKSDEPLLKTLDEYKKELEEKRVHTQFNTRKANEGEDKSKWKKTYVLKKKPEVDDDEVEYEEIEVEEDPNKRKNRQILDIEVQFRSSEDGREFGRRGRGGPGGAGRGGPGGAGRGGPGGAGRGGPGGAARGGPGGGRGAQSGGQHNSRRGGRSERNPRFQPAPKFDDPNDFPSLSA